MLIAGFQKMTLLDYPDKIAALIFTQGCNFACGYCHNPEMIPSVRILPYQPELEPNAILNFLSRRRGLLDGVVISGGEPTLHADLGDFMESIKSMGFLVKLDTNGSNPEILERLLEKNLLDYIAMDVKHNVKDYQSLVKNDCVPDIQKSIEIIKDSGIDYEFRSTLVPGTHESKDISAMGEMIRGAKQWYLQNFRPLKTLTRNMQLLKPFTPKELKKFQEIANKYAKLVQVRNG